MDTSIDNATDFTLTLYKYKASRIQISERERSLTFLFCMQRFLMPKAENPTPLVLLQVLFSAEESASLQPISIRINYCPRQIDNMALPASP